VRRFCFKSSPQMALGIEIGKHKTFRFMADWQWNIG